MQNKTKFENLTKFYNIFLNAMFWFRYQFQLSMMYTLINEYLTCHRHDFSNSTSAFHFSIATSVAGMYSFFYLCSCYFFHY